MVQAGAGAGQLSIPKTDDAEPLLRFRFSLGS